MLTRTSGMEFHISVELTSKNPVQTQILFFPMKFGVKVVV